jgi:hypothetical protein
VDQALAEAFRVMTMKIAVIWHVYYIFTNVVEELNGNGFLP